MVCSERFPLYSEYWIGSETRSIDGAAAGFSPASLLSISAFPQTFLHNGAANSLSAVLDNVTHRSAGTSGVDTLTSPADRAKLVAFITSIDAASPIFP